MKRSKRQGPWDMGRRIHQISMATASAADPLFPSMGSNVLAAVGVLPRLLLTFVCVVWPWASFPLGVFQ